MGHYVFQKSIDLIKENGSTWKRQEVDDMPQKQWQYVDNIDDLALLPNTLAQAEPLIHSIEEAVEVFSSMRMQIKRSICIKKATSSL